MNFPSQIFFNDINHGCRAAILKKNYLWLLSFYMVMATYFYYEKMRRTMLAAIVSNLLKHLFHDQSYIAVIVIHVQHFSFKFNVLGTRNGLKKEDW